MSEQNEAVTSEAAVREMRATLRANPASAPATPAMAVGGVAIAPRSVPGDQASTGVAPPDEVTQSRVAPESSGTTGALADLTRAATPADAGDAAALLATPAYAPSGGMPAAPTADLPSLDIAPPSDLAPAPEPVFPAAASPPAAPPGFRPQASVPREVAPEVSLRNAAPAPPSPSDDGAVKDDPADAPRLTAADATGAEDSAIALDLRAALSDLDGSETLSIAIIGVPAGPSLSAGTRQVDGSWVVTPQQLSGLTITPGADFAGALRLSVTATATEARGGVATTTTALTVQVDARADAATLAASGEGAEDGWITIRGSLTTTDASETLGDTLTVGGLPPGAILSHGQEVTPGTWTVPRAAFEAGQLAIRPPANADADIRITLTATTIDGADQRETTATATIVVRAVADAPTIQVADVTGAEDTFIRLAGLGGALSDTDGSETLNFTLTGVPATATLSAGTRNTDGSWSLTPAQLAGASIRPPANFSGAMNLTLNAVAREGADGAAPSTTSAGFKVSVNPVADAGTISGSAAGLEDTLIVLRPAFATPDSDGSESWGTTTRITGVPTGVTLTRGTEASAGVWDVSTAELRAGSISLRPAANSDADFTLTYTTSLSDTGNGTTVTRTITGTNFISVNAVADAPIAYANNVVGNEDSPIALNFGARLTDTDGSEVLVVVLSGVPAGASLSHSTNNGNGSWSIPTGDLGRLSITPPRDFSGEMRLTMTATARDQNMSTASTTATFTVQVDAVADAPSLRVAAAAGNEDSAIDLRVSAATTDLDGSERITGFRLLDVPEGATVRAGGVTLSREPDGSVVVSAAAAPTLTITPPVNSDRDFTLRVTGISEEPNGSRAESAAAPLAVRVDAVADAPIWVRVGAAGVEDTVIPLDLSARLADVDGSERLSFVVSGLPAGATLSAGTYRGPGSWSLTADEAAIATITPPRDFAGTIQLSVSAVAQEQDGGRQALTTVSFPVRVTAVVDTTSWETTARGNEDAPIALALAPALLDRDGSERLVGAVIIEGVPEGAVLRDASGKPLEGGGGAWKVSADQLRGITITMPADSDVAVRLTVRAEVEDTGGVRAAITGSILVDPRGVADQPRLEVENVQVQEHQGLGHGVGWARLPISARPVDLDGSETTHVWVRDVPEGFALSTGTPAGGGAWLLRAEDLPGLEIRPPARTSGVFTLRIQAVTVEDGGDTATAESRLTVTIDAKGGGTDRSRADPAHFRADAPALTLAAEAAQEDGSARLIIRAELQDSHGGRETLGIRVEGVPSGGRLSAGTQDGETGIWVLRPDELKDLAVIPPADFAGEIKLTVTAVAVEATGDVATTRSSVAVHFKAVADGAGVNPRPDAGIEDRAIPLNLTLAPGDADGSETLVAVTISGLPRGAAIAPGAGIRDGGNGTWTIAPEALGDVRMIPPAHAHGSFGLTVTTTTREASNGAEATVSRGVSVTVAASADAPSASAMDATGHEDQPIALNLSAALRDTDGSETMSIVIAGLPDGARLSAGINNGDGSWTLTPPQIGGLTLTPPLDWSGSMALTMTAHAMERSTAEVASTQVAFRVAVAGVADAPLAAAATTARGSEDQPIAVGIVARLTDTDGSENLVVIVTGVPAGARFSSGTVNGDGSWSIAGADLPGLTVTAPPNYAGTMRLDFAVTAVEADGGRSATNLQMAVTVDPVADAPAIAFTGLIGTEDTALRLPIAATLTDTDGSESIARFTVSGMPTGATLSAGSRATDGTWTLTPAQAASVNLTPPANFAGAIMLTVTAFSREGATGAEASSSAILPITVRPVADAALLTTPTAAGTEDQSVALSLTAGLRDTDGSESITGLVLSGLPMGFSLTAGTAQPDGSVVLRPADLAGLRLRPPADWNGTVSLTLSATVQDGDSTTTTQQPFSVSVAAVNDAPRLQLVASAGAATGQASADIIHDATITDVDSPMMGGATITLTGGAATDRLAFADHPIQLVGGRSMLGSTGIEVSYGASRQVTLTGSASANTYAEVMEGMAVETTSSAGLASGSRSIGVTLRDSSGATAGTQSVTLNIQPSQIAGDGSDQVLNGTTGHDLFIGSAGDEWMRGGAGADVFSIAMGGGHDTVEGGTGAWTDEIRLTSAPATGNWTLVLDPGVQSLQSSQAIDFSQPASGHIQFADGGQLEFSQIERITW